MKKKKKKSSMLSPMMDVIGIGISEQMVGSIGATGATYRVLRATNTVAAAGALKKQSLKI